MSEWLQATPVDHALPVVALLVIAIAVTLRGTNWPGAILCALPLLAACVICFPDERHRLLAYGIVFAAAYCGAVMALREPRYWQCAVLTLVAISLLRWIAREKIGLAREVVIAAGALLIVAVMRRGAFAIAVAVLAAFVSPGIPARTALIPVSVAIVIAVARLLPLPARPSSTESGGVVAAFLLFVPLMLFAWSGVAARALPYFFRERPARSRIAVGYALKPGESVVIDVPQDAQSLAISLANGLQLKRGTVVATVDGRRVKIGDVADWGAMRREVWWRSRNVLPTIPAGRLRGYGYDGWVDGAGRVALPPHSTHVRVVADTRLPVDARLQVEGFER